MRSKKRRILIDSYGFNGTICAFKSVYFSLLSWRVWASHWKSSGAISGHFGHNRINSKWSENGKDKSNMFRCGKNVF